MRTEPDGLGQILEPVESAASHLIGVGVRALSG